MDLGLRLRELRLRRGLRQADVARLTGVGEKSISSFETGDRTETIKLSQLRRLLRVYGVTECEFFAGTVDDDLDAVTQWDQASAEKIADRMRRLPVSIREPLLEKFRLLVETASQIHAIDQTQRLYSQPEMSDWQMLTSRN